MKIIDAHHHFWTVTDDLYTWLNDKDLDLLWGKPTDLPRNYLPGDIVAAAGNWELSKSVHVQCFHNPENPVEETQWLQGLADESQSRGYPQAIVGFADFSSDRVEHVLSQHCEYKNMRGIRQILNRHPNEMWHMSDRDFMQDAAWRSRFGLLAKYGLSFDLQIFYHQVADAIQLAIQHPNILIILNHAGMPADRDAESIDAWRAAMKQLASCDNIVAKISGLGMCDKQWTTDSIRPFVMDVIEAFEIHRCMFGSNFPVDSLFSDYQSVWDAYDAITFDLSEAERNMLFHDNAERYYRI